MIRSLLAVLSLALASVCHGVQGDIVKTGQVAPGFAGTSTDGSVVELRSFAGKVVLLDFFATWCGPCLEEMPRIETDIWRKFRAAGVVVIGIGREHDVAELKEFREAKRLTFQILADPKREIYSRYATEYIPRCYLVGKDGKVKYAIMGYDPEEFAQLTSAVAAELKK